MARMLPDYISPDCKSAAERRLYGRFREELPASWTVLHSLGLAQHHSKLHGEADFVIVAEKGILVLEVKGGRVECKDGRWYFTNRYGEMSAKAESPMTQVKGAMFALRKRLEEHFAGKLRIKDVPFGTGVIFPDIDFRKESPEWDLLTIFDRSRSQRPMSVNLDELYDVVREEYVRVYGRGGAQLLSENDRARIVDFLRGEFHFVPPMVVMVDEVARHQIRLSAEQFGLLEQLAENPRMVIHGGAGTGKTLLAFEKARRHACHEEKVLLLCFNKMLSSHLRLRAEQERLCEFLTVSTLHSYCMRLIDEAGLRDRLKGVGQEDLFARVIPELVPEALLVLDIGAPFDVLVIDEGQDFKGYAPFADVADLLLKGGLAKGMWAWFEDDQQSIFRYPEGSAVVDLSRFHPVKYRLTKNWRNTKAIMAFTGLATGTGVPECHVEGGPPVEYRWYSSAEHQKKELKNTVTRLFSEKVAAADIILLSAVGENRSVLHDLKEIGGIPLVSVEDEAQSGTVLRWTSIYKFKGLEEKVVILTDVGGFSTPEFRNTNYVGMTRANAVLILLVDASKQDELRSMSTEFGKRLAVEVGE